jgi:mono/diheme cytochrome c family protein
MRRLLRWLAGTLLALAAITGIALGWVYLASESHLRSFTTPPRFDTAVPTDAETVARGGHLVETRGCRGCHGTELEGALMWGYAVAPNLPALVRDHGIAALEAGLRHGIGVDGKALYSMPAFSFIHLRDEDVVAIAAYLLVAPVKHVELPAPRLPWAIRWEIARGNDMAIPGFLGQVPALQYAAQGDSPLARGEYIAMTTCIECHGFRLRGDELFGGTAPDLIVMAGYDEAAFTKLMRTGKALGDRELERMSRVARRRFANLTDGEVRDLYAFLKERIATTPTRR